MQIKHMSKRDAVSLLELIHAGTKCNDISTFNNLMKKLGNIISYDYACCELARFGKEHIVDTMVLHNIGFPDEYLGMYQRDGWRRIDPIQKDVVSQSGARYWADIFRKNNPPKWMHAAALDFRVKDGYTQAVWDRQKGTGSLFYFSGNIRKRDERTEAVLGLVIPHLHQAFTKILKESCTVGACLSAREKEILSWLKKGKTTWDISVLLGISERTVKFHISNIMKKLDAATRAHAVAIAIEQGLVDIE